MYVTQGKGGTRSCSGEGGSRQKRERVGPDTGGGGEEKRGEREGKGKQRREGRNKGKARGKRRERRRHEKRRQKRN